MPWIVTAVLLLTLSGCGFSLKGTQSSLPAAVAVHTEYNQHTYAHALALKLGESGVRAPLSFNPQTAPSSGAVVVLGPVTKREIPLLGTIREVNLELVVPVSWYESGVLLGTADVAAKESYQLNAQSVSTGVQQEKRVLERLNNKLAVQISNLSKFYFSTPSP